MNLIWQIEIEKIITLQVYSLCQGDLQSQLQVLKWYNDSIVASIRSNSGRRNSVPIRSLQGLYAIGNGVKHKDFSLHGSQEMALFTHNTSTSALISIHSSSTQHTYISHNISVSIYISGHNISHERGVGRLIFRLMLSFPTLTALHVPHQLLQWQWRSWTIAIIL